MAEIQSTLDDNRAVVEAARNVEVATGLMESAIRDHAGIQGEIDIVASKHENGEKRLYLSLIHIS